jgi:hypothetical protein
MSEPFDLDKHLADQARARALGMDYSEIRSIILSVGADGDAGISEGRAVELVREMALRAVDRAVAEERAAVVAWLRSRPGYGPVADSVEEGEHLREHLQEKL